MKKLLSIILLAVATFGFFSCEEVDDPFYTGVAIYVADMDFYKTDPGLTSDIMVSDETLTKITTDIGVDITVANGAGTFTFTQADLGTPEAGESVDVTFSAEVSGGTASRVRTIKCLSPMTIEGPENISPFVDEDIYIVYSYASDATAATTVTMRTRVNGGAWTDAKMAWDLVKDSIAINGTDYNALDTLDIELTVSNSNGTVVDEFEIVFKAPPFNKQFFGWYEEYEDAYGAIAPVYFFGDEDDEFHLTIYGFWTGVDYDGLDITDPTSAGVYLEMTLDPFTNTVSFTNEDTGWGYLATGTGTIDLDTKEFNLVMDLIDPDDGSIAYDDMICTYEPTDDPNDAKKKYNNTKTDKKSIK